MRILHRQIFKEVLSHGLLGLILFTFVLFLRDTSRLLELVLRETTFWGQAIYLTGLLVPPLLSFTVPMAVLLGVLLGLSRMTSDGEVVALRASGASVRVFLLPVGLFTIGGCLLAVYCSAYFSPAAVRRRVDLERQIGLRQISAELQPRVFEERFPDLVIYVQDVISGAQPGWRGIFLADMSKPDHPKITLAQKGLLFSDPEHSQLQLHLEGGSIHETGESPGEYSVATFSETDIPIRLPPPEAPNVKPNSQRTNAELYSIPGNDPEWLEARIEFHRRFALPMAALFLTLFAIPLGLASQRGGRSSGIILTIGIVLSYYLLLVSGMSLARQRLLSPWAGVWASNLLFGAAGVYLLSRVDRVTPLLDRLSGIAALPQAMLRKLAEFAGAGSQGGRRASTQGIKKSILPMVLDRYVARSFLFQVAAVVAALVLITEVATFFLDLLNDVISNQIPTTMVLNYFFYLTPQLIYVTTPIGVLVAVLVGFAVLTHNNEITAVKASGVSLYRLTLPVLLMAGILSVGLFAFEMLYVPSSNRRQDAIRNTIKGRPAQTYYRPDRKWIIGEDSRIYYYNVFEPNERVLGGVTVFEIDPATYQLTRRVTAARAQWSPELSGWMFEEGWVRELGNNVVKDFQQFPVRVFPEFREPPTYFLKEVKQSSQMNFLELRNYVGDLQRSGFDVVPLSVQLQKKFSFPLFALIMALIGLPFAFSVGKKGALTGIAISIVIAMTFWGLSSFFEALGNLNQLPPIAAAWSPDFVFGLGGLYLFLRIRT